MNIGRATLSELNENTDEDDLTILDRLHSVLNPLACALQSLAWEFKGFIKWRKVHTFEKIETRAIGMADGNKTT